MLFRASILAVLITFSVLAKTPTDKTQDNRLYWASVAAMAAGSAADGATSYGGGELNPLLRGKDGRLGKKGISIKAAIVGGTIVAQWICGKRARKTFTKVNFALAGFSGALTARTVRLKRKHK